MLNKPHFQPAYAVETIEPDQVFILSERETVVLSDRLSCRVASLVRDSDLSLDEIIEIIQLELLQEQQASGETTDFVQHILDVSIKAQHVLFQMEQRGYLVEKDETMRSHLAIFCHHLNITPAVAKRRLQSIKVAVKATKGLPCQEFIASLKSLDIQVADTYD